MADFPTNQPNPKNKEVLFLLHLPPPIHGSSVVGKAIFSSDTINGNVSGYYINLLASKDVNDTGKKYLKKIFLFTQVIFKVIFRLIKSKPDVCYFAITTTGIAFLKDSLLVFLLKIFKVKILFHLHNKGVVSYQNKYPYKQLYKYVFRNTDVIILSKILYSDVKLFVPLDRIHICHNGVNDSYPGEKNIREGSTSIASILFLSNLIESKGVFILLQACTHLISKKIPFQCIFVGGEGDISQIEIEEKIKQLGLENHVSYLGKKYGAEKTDIFMKSDIFVLPTFYNNECFPLVILEAMSMKLPVVSTYEGGIPDIVEEGQTGLLLSSISPLELSEKLEILIKDKALRERMGELAREKFIKHYQISKFETTMLNIIKSI